MTTSKDTTPEQKPVGLPNYDRVPRWLIIQQEIDCRLYILRQMSAKDKKTPLEHMIDEATGYDKHLLEEAKELIAELRWLKAEYDKETA